MKRLLRLAPWMMMAGLVFAVVAVYVLTPVLMLGAIVVLLVGIGLEIARRDV